MGRKSGNRSMLWWNYQQLRVSSAKTRLAVVQKLADNRDPDAAGPLIFALQDKDAEVRAAAAKALSGFHDKRALEPLMNLLRDTNAPVRAAAAETLGNLGDQSSAPVVTEALSDPNSDVPRQPSYARNWHRLINPEFAVLVGACRAISSSAPEPGRMPGRQSRRPKTWPSASR